MGRVGDREVLTAVGATGADGGRITQTFATMPDVGPVDESARATVAPRCRRRRRRTSAPPSSARPSSTAAPRAARPRAWRCGRGSTGHRRWTPDPAGLRRRRRADGDPPRARGPPTRRHEPRQLHPRRSPRRHRVGAARAPRRRPPTTGTGTAASTCGHPTAPSPASPARRSPSARHDRRPRRRPPLGRRRRLPRARRRPVVLRVELVVVLRARARPRRVDLPLGATEPVDAGRRLLDLRRDHALPPRGAVLRVLREHAVRSCRRPARHHVRQRRLDAGRRTAAALPAPLRRSRPPRLRPRLRRHHGAVDGRRRPLRPDDARDR